MDITEISDIFRENHRNQIKWSANQEDIRAKKVRLHLGKI